MKYRILAVAVLSILVFNLAGSTYADSKAKRASLSQLVALLPASDGVVTLDGKRFFGDAMQRFLSGNSSMLGKITTKIEEFQADTGIDIRKFDEIAVGANARPIAEKKYDIDPVVIARGQMTSASLISAAKGRADGKFREERIGSRVIYIFNIEKAAARAAADTKIGTQIREVAVVALDDKTLAFGTLERVRSTVDAKTKVGTDLIGMLGKSPAAAVAAFAAKPPAGLKNFVPLDSDELGKNIDAIQYIYGDADFVADNASVHVTARTQQNSEAMALYDFLDIMHGLGKMAVSASSKPEKAVYARMLDNAKFSVKANEVMLDLTVPKSDIDVLVGLIK